jgi:tetratricopeptide (TPR) repeat protein
MLNEESRLELPAVPAAQASAPVAAWREPLTIDTYLPDVPDRFPAFLEKRVYQGSSGQVYPLPFHERISQVKTPRQWDAIHLENAWVRLVILPELGGRIQVGMDKTNSYDFFYRNNVIKPALVGLAGPWLSGGVEFNWPQHHRPATFLSTDSFIEHESDGAVTVWCSDHDPFARMKGMHGVRLRPGSSVIELRVRLFNRTDDVQSFLWWANVAARAGDSYQSFFPTDVHVVADHAKRAVTTFPQADRPYYGVDYPARVDAENPDADRLDWYRNIIVPTSYMCLGSEDDFFGGYDHDQQAGFVHWADHRVAPGKKQWTWGNSPFGWAWDANLTDTDGPYVELMAGVFTDNQPDFSFLAPGETKAFNQYWYPIREIGPAHQATLDAAVRLDVTSYDNGTDVRVAVGVTSARPGLEVRLVDRQGSAVWICTADAGPGDPFVQTVHLADRFAPTDLTLVVKHVGRELVRWQHRPIPEQVDVPDPATEPPAPCDISTVEELYLTGLHLEQYHHATRSPEPYLLEALARDPQDVRSNVAQAARLYRSGRYAEAETHLRAAIARQTCLNPNPYDAEARYRLGQVLARTERESEAYDAFAKAAWNYAWRVPAHLAMARLDAAQRRDAAALAHVQAVRALDSEQLQARDIAVVLLRRLGRQDEAAALLAETLALDPLDRWAMDLGGNHVLADGPTGIDIALEYATVGEIDAALRIFGDVAMMPTPPGQVAVGPLAYYHCADLQRRFGDPAAASRSADSAQAAVATNCLASRLDDADMLERACVAVPGDARAWGIRGHWLYFQRRYLDAIEAWEVSVGLDDTDSVVWRNLAVAAFNVLGDPELARTRYARALEVSGPDARLVYESDQLAKRTGVAADLRLARLQALPDVVSHRDDLTVEFVELLTAAGEAPRALKILESRHFQPWEGGEGQVLNAWDEALLAMARTALSSGQPESAVKHLVSALNPPTTLGEGRHPLANCSRLLLTLGDAHAEAGDELGAQQAWRTAATFAGDFQSMATAPYSEMTYFSALACRRLGEEAAATKLLDGLVDFAGTLRATPARVDYFATSLPTMLLFTEDIEAVKDTTVMILDAQVAMLRGDRARAEDLLAGALRREPLRVSALELRRGLSDERDPLRATP